MLSGLLNLGYTALTAAQAWISVTGSNIANADTEGYTRRYVDQRDGGTITTKPGGESLGVNAQQVLRYFDAFLESSYVRQSTNSARWSEQETIMSSVENLFNESNRTGISGTLTEFFTAWSDLAQRPDDTATRESLLSYADSLSDMLTSTVDSLKAIQDEMDVSINQAVDRVNTLSKSIADLNNQINARTREGVSNPNDLLDQRDQMVRELAGLIDVETTDNGGGDFTVQLSTGQPLVQGQSSFELDVLDARAESRLTADSTYTGSVEFDGTDSHEYTLEMVTGGDVGDTPPPSFRVSLDGGKTWLRDEDGQELHYTVTDNDGDGQVDPVQVKDLKISFSETTGFTAGDKFDIVPKTGLYWIEPTRGAQNITPQTYLDGTENQNRTTGGTLTAYFSVRDDNCGRYLDELDAVASSLIWEVNRIHSQGTGNTLLDYSQGQQQVESSTQALGSAQSILPNADRLQSGNVNFYFYDKTTGEYVTSGMLDFDSSTAEVENFDPSVHSLEDVANAINSSFPDPNNAGQNLLKASIQDGRLLIETNSASNVQFALGADTSGLMAALGVNAFFTGTGADDLAVNSQMHSDVNYIAAGQVNGQYQVNAGDNATATAIAKLADTTVTISTVWKTVSNQTISQYYANLVTTVGADTRSVQTNAEYHTALTSDLEDQVSSVTGVNLDEEMANLIKYQHSYTAAAKLITTADQMLQTLLGLKE